MARVEVVMPQMGESIVEGTVVAWLKNVGDHVELDEDIFTLSTDKVDAEVPSPVVGVLVELLAEVGDTVEVGKTVAVLETDADADAAKPEPAAAPKPEPAAAPKPASPAATKEPPPVAPPELVAPPAVPKRSAPDAVSAPTPTPAKGAASAPIDGDMSAEELRRRRSTPVVRNIAAEHGIEDLSVIEGSGVGGRVTKKDIVAFIESGGATAAAAAAAAPAATTSAPAATFAQAFAVKPTRVHVFEGDRVEPMSRMRASIAENMWQSRHGTAHCHTVWEADVSAVARARKALKADYEARGVKLTYTAFFVSAVIAGLREFPLLNAAIDGGNIVHRRDVNIGVATAVDNGLIVPVLRGADTLNLFGIAKGINDLSARARTRKLMPQDVADGTFSVSNAGIWGSLFGVPILVQPQVGILGIGGVKKRVVADADENIRVRSMVYMCLTFDHRLIDGATADGFMSYVTGTLANWEH